MDERRSLNWNRIGYTSWINVRKIAARRIGMMVAFAPGNDVLLLSCHSVEQRVHGRNGSWQVKRCDAS